MDETLPPVVQALLRPDAYPHPVQEPIQLLQTHVSYVFLTGDYVYKVKKPVNFGFLDYSTLALRRQYCDREIELNQRGAGDLYLGVVAIAPAGDGLRIDPDGKTGDPVEYAVKMQQFPQDALLTQWFERGELTPELLDQLARAIADFHRSAPSSDYIRDFGRSDRIKQAFDENFAQTTGYIGGPQTQQQFDDTQAWTEDFFAHNGPLIQQRIDTGWIRNCHGDLHLGNICQWRDRLYLFDCIEFNEPFRYVDVMFDIAYIIMDLDARDRPDLAAGFLNTYVERTGDWEGLQILPLYVNRQTYVRAKVISFLLNDPAIPASDREAAAATAARYYRQAWQYTQPRQGRIYLTCGLSGAGKSTAARTLAAQTGAIHIRSDAVRKHLGGVPLDERGPQSLYSPEITAQTYDRLCHLGLTLARCGYPVILDAKYDRQALRGSVLTAAQTADIPLQILHCQAPVDVLRDRLHHRTGDIADATADLLDAQVAAFEPLTTVEQAHCVAIDTTADLASQLAALPST
jgi:aminoglycoside phosphotransferase family enzyme/gluconate kinase